MKLKNKFYLLFFLSTVVVIGTVQIVNLYREKQAFYAKLEERGLALSRTLAVASLSSFATNSFSELKFYMDDVATGDNVEYVAIVDPSGQIVLHTEASQNSNLLYDPVNIRAVRADKSIRQTYTTQEGRIYEVSSPIKFASLRWGTVRVGFNLDNFHREFFSTDSDRK